MLNKLLYDKLFVNDKYNWKKEHFERRRKTINWKIKQSEEKKHDQLKKNLKLDIIRGGEKQFIYSIHNYQWRKSAISFVQILLNEWWLNEFYQTKNSRCGGWNPEKSQKRCLGKRPTFLENTTLWGKFLLIFP